MKAVQRDVFCSRPHAKEWELRLHLLCPVWRQHAMAIARHPSEQLSVYFEDGAAVEYETQAYR